MQKVMKVKFEQIKKDEHQYLMHTYGRFNVAIESGNGAVATDVDGRNYIDFAAGIGVNCLGYCDKGWLNVVIDQLKRVQHISNLYYSPVQVECARQLCSRTGFSKVFFCNSGAEANECAIKLARKYSFDKYGENRNQIISLRNSFHGRTITTLSATGQDIFHQYFFPFADGFVFANADDVSSVEALLGYKTCAVMLELVQGEGGVVPLKKDFVLAIEKLCRKKDLMLIIDEVQTGVGRTGKLYCYENYGITPDIVTSAKGLGGGFPFGACLCSERLADVMGLGTHGTTFGGNPVACAGAVEILNRVGAPGFLQQVNEKGEYIRERLLNIKGVLGVRGLGMMIGVVLERDNAKEVAARCAENGLLVLTAKSLLRLLPPLNISYEEIDEGIEILKNSL